MTPYKNQKVPFGADGLGASKKEKIVVLIIELLFLEIAIDLDEGIIGVIQQKLEILEELVLVGR